MKAELLAQVKALDPTPLDADMPVGTWSAAVVLHEIERRTDMDTRDTTKKEAPPGVTQQIEPSPSPSPKTTERLTKETGKRRWSGALVGAAAFAVVVLVVGGVILLASLGSDEVGPAAPVTTQAPATITSDGALAVSGDYIEASNTGDADAVMALLTPDATFSTNFTGPMDRVFFEQRLARNIAQGSIFTAPECAVTEEGTRVEVKVSCVYGTHDAPSQAVGGPPVSTVLTIVVTPYGIRQLAFGYGQPDFNYVGRPFENWVLVNHSDDAEAVAFGNWASVDDAQRSGRLIAQYAEEWAAFLEANDCDWQSVVCRPVDQ